MKSSGLIYPWSLYKLPAVTARQNGTGEIPVYHCVFWKSHRPDCTLQWVTVGWQVSNSVNTLTGSVGLFISFGLFVHSIRMFVPWHSHPVQIHSRSFRSQPRQQCFVWVKILVSWIRYPTQLWKSCLLWIHIQQEALLIFYYYYFTWTRVVTYQQRDPRSIVRCAHVQRAISLFLIVAGFCAGRDTLTWQSICFSQVRDNKAMQIGLPCSPYFRC